MNQKDLFQHYITDVRAILGEGANPRELIQVLAAVSVDLALNVAPSTEYAFLTVLEGIRDMALVHAKRNEDAEDDSENEEPERDTDSAGKPSDEHEMDDVFSLNTTIH